jgi:two-component system NtrC family sensor kinase
VDAFLVLDENLNFVSINPAMQKLLNLSEEDVVGKNVLDVVPDIKETGRYDRYLNVIKTGEPFSADDISVHPKFGNRTLNIKAFKVGSELGIIASDITERKQMEEAFRENEERFRSLYSVMNEGVCLHEIIYDESGRAADYSIIDVNPAYESILGLSREKAIGSKASELYGASKPPYLELYAKVADSGEPLSFETYFPQIEMHFLISVFSARKGQFATVFTDVTQHKQAVEALQESEAHYRLLAENVTDVIWTMDMSLRYTYVSPSVTRLRGYSVEEAMALGIEGALTPDSLEVARQAFAEEMALENMGQKDLFRSRTLEQELYCKDGSTIWTEIRITFLRDQDDQPVGILGVTRDITERKRVEEELRQSEHNYRVLFESTIDGMGVIDAETMKLVLANHKGAEMFGFDSVEDTIGVNPLDSIHPDDRDRAAKAIIEDVFEKDLRGINEFRAFTKDGREVWISAVGTRTEYQGRLAGLVSVRDITERKKVEEEKQRMEEQLQLAGRLAAVGQLAAGVAHELNNPLSAVQGFAQFLAERDNLDETTKSGVETIYREAQRAAKITRNLLSFGRRYAPEKSLISINEVIERTLDINAHRLQVNNIGAAVKLEPGLPKTMADPDQMQQVFVNIINNAEQAMLGGQGRGNLYIKTQKVGDNIRITFTDNGPGVSEENLKKIFDPFFTTKEVGKGTGLGLSICYGLVEGHGGHIYAYSKPGKGATFAIEIPIVSEEHHVAEQPDLVYN